MSRYQSAYSASDLLEKLSEKALVQSGDEALEDFVLEQQREKELPLYLRALVGIGAVITSLCLIGLVALGLEINSEEGFIVSGLIFVGMAILLQKRGGDGGTVWNSFLLQSSFAFMATGKSLFVFGVGLAFESGWAVTAALLFLTAATYHIYRMSVDRFLSSFAVFFSILVNSLWGEEFAGSKELLFNGIMLLQVILAAVLICNAKVKRDYAPIKYGLLFSLSAAALFLASHTEFGYWQEPEAVRPVFVNLLFTASLIASIAWIAGGVTKLTTEPLILAALGAVALGAISVPGVVLSIILMVLGYAKHERIMTTMGALLVPVFLFFYYYNLDVSLLQKSGVLVGSGIALLAGRFYLSFRKWDRGEVT